MKSYKRRRRLSPKFWGWGSTAAYEERVTAYLVFKPSKLYCPYHVIEVGSSDRQGRSAYVDGKYGQYAIDEARRLSPEETSRITIWRPGWKERVKQLEKEGMKIV